MKKLIIRAILGMVAGGILYFAGFSLKQTAGLVFVVLFVTGIENYLEHGEEDE